MKDLKIKGPLVLELVSDGAWRVNRSIGIIWGNRFYFVPKGTLTDLNSLGRVPLLYMLFGACANLASCVHDYFYQTGEVSRREADQIFYAAMRKTGIGRIRAYCMWLGVRIFAGEFYKKKGKEEN
jgi:hypothetical protein